MLFNRSTNQTIDGVDLVFRPMKASQHFALVKAQRERPDDGAFGQAAIYECTFLPSGERAFASPAEVMDVPTCSFGQLMDAVNTINGWNDAGVEAAKKN